MQKTPDQEIADRPQALPGARGVIGICLACGLPGPIGVEVIISASEASHLHDQKVRHGAVACLNGRRGNELALKRLTLARMAA